MMSGAIASLTRAGIAPSADSARKWISGGRALGGDDADRLAGADAVRPVPPGVAVAQPDQVVEAVALEDHLAAVVDDGG